jgi:hypothetical protein
VKDASQLAFVLITACAPACSSPIPDCDETEHTVHLPIAATSSSYEVTMNADGSMNFGSQHYSSCAAYCEKEIATSQYGLLKDCRIARSAPPGAPLEADVGAPLQAWISCHFEGVVCSRDAIIGSPGCCTL